MKIIQLIDKKNGLIAERTKIINGAQSEKRKLNDGETASVADLTGQIAQVEQDIATRELELTQQKPPVQPRPAFRFSLMNAINAVVNNRSLDEDTAAVVEAGRAEMRKSGLSYGGQIVLPSEYRATIQATIANQGMENVPEDLLGILEPLRNRLIMVQAGAHYMSGLVGDISIPVYSGSNVQWAGEVAPAPDGAGTFTELKLSPKRLTAYLDISKQFLLQDSNSAEALLKADLIRALQEKLEVTLLGSGAAGATSPGGIFNIITPTPAVSTWTDLVAMETALEQANVYGDFSYLLSPSAKGLFRTVSKEAGTGLFIMNGGEIDGIKALTSTSVLANNFVLGNWSDYLIGQWGGIDLTVDPYTQAGNAKIRIVINAFFDAKPRRTQSFQTASIV